MNIYLRTQLQPVKPEKCKIHARWVQVKQKKQDEI